TERAHPEHPAPKKSAAPGAVAARQQTAADDGADDEDELEPDALPRLHRAQLERLDDPHQGGSTGSHHEERDLGADDGDAGVPRSDRVASGAVDPVAEAGLGEDPRTDDRD